MTSQKPLCVYCDRTSDEVPLLVMHYRDEEIWICPQHLPVLIHNPEKLAGKLPGSESFSPGSQDQGE